MTLGNFCRSHLSLQICKVVELEICLRCLQSLLGEIPAEDALSKPSRRGIQSNPHGRRPQNRIDSRRSVCPSAPDTTRCSTPRPPGNEPRSASRCSLSLTQGAGRYPSLPRLSVILTHEGPDGSFPAYSHSQVRGTPPPEGFSGFCSRKPASLAISVSRLWFSKAWQQNRDFIPSRLRQ